MEIIMNPTKLAVSRELGFPISQEWSEVGMLTKYARLIPPHQCIVEIGTRNGGSAIVLAMSSRSRVYTIDILEDSRTTAWGYDEVPPLREHWDSFEFGDRIHKVTCNSWEYEHRGEPIGMVFIDGDHSEEGISKDWEHFYPIVEPGGYVLCHDYGDPNVPWVKRYLDEVGLPILDRGGTTVVFRKEEI